MKLSEKVGGTRHRKDGLQFKMPMKWNFRLLFYSKLLKSMILWFVIFKFGLWTSAHEFFLELESWPIRVKMCDIPRAVKICKLYGFVPISILLFVNFLRFKIPVSQSKLARLTPNLGILWIVVCSFWLCGSIVANPIIYRLVPSPSRYEIRPNLSLRMI